MVMQNEWTVITGYEKMNNKTGFSETKIQNNDRLQARIYLFVLLMYSLLKDLGTFSICPQIYIKLTWFEGNDSGKLPFKY